MIMHRQTIAHRIISFSIVALSILIGCQLYWYAPWRYDAIAFLIRPLLCLAIPLFITGFVLMVKSPVRWPHMIFPCILLMIGGVSLMLLHDWPSQYIATAWEDSYQMLAALEAGYLLMCGPFIVCCIISIWSPPRRWPRRATR
jgi:hypothetical protein